MKRPDYRFLAPAALLMATSIAVGSLAVPARADAPDAGSPDTDDASADGGASQADDAGAGSVSASCIEHLPDGVARPDLVEEFPSRGLSGYAVSLVVRVGHGKGEKVLPEGFRVHSESDEGRALRQAGFVVPDQDGGSPASIEREEKANGATTKLTLPVVPLPPEAGRNLMTLPPLPIAIQRASGQLITVCSAPHRIRVEDPIANEADPKVKPNPPPRSQREDWALARQVTIGVLIGVVLTALALWAAVWWRRRPKPVKLAPRKLPWVQALEELKAIRASTLLADGNTDLYFDRVSDSVRKYLGARYGFDGLESTTDEMKSTLRRVRPPIQRFGEIVTFLEECDLVKFARVVPRESECIEALGRGEAIVHMTIPPLVTNDPKEAA